MLFITLDIFSKGNKTIPDLNDQQVLIVDDVVFSGQTLFQALRVVSLTKT